MRISFIIPSRNNLKYLQQAVSSIMDCYGDDHDIVLLDDASTDGTWDWIESLSGDHFVKYKNEGPERVGHTILYDKGVELSRTDAFTIFHADMITTPNHIPNLLKHLAKKTVVAATRIEPPLHPPGPEKHVRAFGFEPEEFQKEKFNHDISLLEQVNEGKITKGVFAPWCMYKEEFQAIGGHDPLFAPMELEDSDIFNRMHLAGFNLIQSRDAFVYHMTCRGSRFKDGIEIEAEIPLPDGTIWYKPKDSEEYKHLRMLKFREWHRKWASDVLHDELLHPIINPRFNTGYVVLNCDHNLLSILEPWCDNIYIQDDNLRQRYCAVEQPNTQYNLKDRVRTINFTDDDKPNNIVIKFDATKLTNENFKLLQQMPLIIKETGELGQFELDIFTIIIKDLTEYQNNLIHIYN